MVAMLDMTPPLVTPPTISKTTRPINRERTVTNTRC